jgi:hypothetical protein
MVFLNKSVAGTGHSFVCAPFIIIPFDLTPGTAGYAENIIPSGKTRDAE